MKTATGRKNPFLDDDDELDEDDESSPRGPVYTSEDCFERAAAFDGLKLRVQSKQFRSGRITAVLSGVTLDLRDAELCAEGATISVQSALSGIDILVPSGWHVVCDVDGVMSGVDDGCARTEPTERGPRLTVTGVAVASGLAVR
jgi:hypothetical protein